MARLPADSLDKIEKHLITHMKDGCWVCKDSDWLIFPTLLGEDFYDEAGRYMTSASMGPKVRLTCRTCGNIIYFSAESMGVKLDIERYEPKW